MAGRMLVALFASHLMLYFVENADSTCVSESYVNGCSVPLSVPFPYKSLFQPACNRHDVCYYCGQKYGWSRADCDRAFKRDMDILCTINYNRKRFFSSAWQTARNALHLSSEIAKWPTIKGDHLHCKQGAYIYYLAVDYFGQDNYVSSSPSWCSQACAKANGNPTH